MPPLIVEAFFCVIYSPEYFYMTTVRKMKNKPKTSPKNLYSCNKTKANILYKKTTKRTRKKTTLKPINKGKINEGKPLKKPLKKPLYLFTYKNNCIDYQLITKISKKRLKKICRYKIYAYLYIRKQTNT